MAAKKPPLIRIKDLAEILRLSVLAMLSWTIPERHWNSVALRLADLISWIPEWRRKRAGRERGGVFGQRFDTATQKRLRTEFVAHQFLARMQGFREYRPDGWHPDVRVVGVENIEAALDQGHGAILWITPFAFSHLVTKKGLYEAGIRVSHLSRANHGFSSTRFGIRMMNPIWTRIENRYLGERVMLSDTAGSQAALGVLRQRLTANGVVSITVYDQAKRTVEVPFLNSRLRLATGPLHLARTTKAPLLPVFTLRIGPQEFQVNIGLPLEWPTDAEDKEPYEAVVRSYVQILERFVLEYPNQWHQTWGEQ